MFRAALVLNGGGAITYVTPWMFHRVQAFVSVVMVRFALFAAATLVLLLLSIRTDLILF